jgi:hypothetical protein
MREFNYGIACKQKRWDLAELFDTTANYASQLDSGGSPPQALRDEFASFESVYMRLLQTLMLK